MAVFIAGHPILESGFVGQRCDEDVKVNMPLKVGIDRDGTATVVQGKTQIQIKSRCRSRCLMGMSGL